MPALPALLPPPAPLVDPPAVPAIDPDVPVVDVADPEAPPELAEGGSSLAPHARAATGNANPQPEAGRKIGRIPLPHPQLILLRHLLLHLRLRHPLRDARLRANRSRIRLTRSLELHVVGAHSHHNGSEH